MLKKSISAALLLSIVVWAEITMAPMLAMGLWHSHAGQEMAKSMTAGSTMAGSTTAHHHTIPAGHPCCPRPGKVENTALLELAATSLPCHDEHRCCFLQGPQNLPAPVTAAHRFSPEAAALEISDLRSGQTESYFLPMIAVATGPPPGLLGMVLRV